MDKGRGNSLMRPWLILLSMASGARSLEEIAAENKISRKTVYRHLIALQQVGFVFNKLSYEDDERVKLISLSSRLKRLVQELDMNRNIAEPLNDDVHDENVCGHDTLHGENVPGCKGCRETFRDYEEELKDARRVTDKKNVRQIPAQVSR